MKMPEPVPAQLSRAKTGIPGLDDILSGCLDVGTSTLFIGPAGAGKSSLSLAYACAAAERGDRVHGFLFDESVSIAMRRARNLGLKTELLLNENRLTVEQIDPAELCPGEFVQKIRDSVEQIEAAGQVRKALSVVKARGGEHEPTIRELSFRGSRIAVGEPLSGFQGILTGVPTFTGSASGLQEASRGDAAP